MYIQLRTVSRRIPFMMLARSMRKARGCVRARTPTNISLVIKIHTYNADQVCNWLRGRLHKRSCRDLDPSVHKECSLIRVTLLSADDRCILLHTVPRRPPQHTRFNLILGKLRAKIYVKYQRPKIEKQGGIGDHRFIFDISNYKFEKSFFFFFSFSLLVCDCCITRLPFREEQQLRSRFKDSPF